MIADFVAAAYRVYTMWPLALLSEEHVIVVRKSGLSFSAEIEAFIRASELHNEQRRSQQEAAMSMIDVATAVVSGDTRHAQNILKRSAGLLRGSNGYHGIVEQ